MDNLRLQQNAIPQESVNFSELLSGVIRGKCADLAEISEKKTPLGKNYGWKGIVFLESAQNSGYIPRVAHQGKFFLV